MGPRASLDDMEKGKFLTLPGLELRPLGCPAHSQSLYRLHYPGSRCEKQFKIRSELSDFNRSCMCDGEIRSKNWLQRDLL
jgi:hypothetical protein